MKKHTRIVMTLIVPVILAIVFLIILLVYIIDRNAHEESMRRSALLSAVTEQRTRFSLMLDNRFTALDVFSNSMDATQAETSDKTLQQMRHLVDSAAFQEILLVSQTGEVQLHAGTSVLAEPATYLGQSLAGERTLSMLTLSGKEGDPGGLVFAVPVWQNERASGAVAGMLGRAALNDLFQRSGMKSFETVVFDAEGNAIFTESECVLGKAGDSIYGWLGSTSADSRKLTDQLKADRVTGGEGTGTFQRAGEQWYLAYAPLGVNDWSIGLLIPANQTEAALYIANENGYELVAVILLGALLLSLHVLLVYRTETARSLRERERLITAEEEYRISAKQGGIMVARFDIESGALLSSQGTIEHLQMQLDSIGFTSYTALEKLVAAESAEDFRAFWALIREGKTHGQSEICLQGADGTRRWYTLEFAAIGDGGGTNIQVIVTIRDINELHERMTSYRHWQNHILTSLGIYTALMEVNLTTGIYERLEGEFRSSDLPQDADNRAEPVLERFSKNEVSEGSRQRFQTFASLPRLRDLAARGIPKEETEIWLAREDGAERLCLLTAQMAPLPKTGEIKAFLTLQELNSINLEIERLSNLALYDELSGLLNRTAARNAIEETLRYGTGERVALFMIDADNFKLVNDTLGHQHGDLALIQISQAIQSVFRASDILARIGGDEFFVFLPEVAGEEFAQSKAAALCNALHLTYTAGNTRGIELTASIGVVVAQRNQVDYETLYAEADRALYEAKKAGKNRYCIHTPDQADASKPSQPQLVGYDLQMQSLLKHLDGGVVMFEVGDRIQPIFVSEGYFMLRGVMAEAIANGTFPESTIHPHDFPMVSQAVRVCAQDGEPFQISYRNVLADGGYGWRHMNAIRVPSLTEDRPLLLSVISDITELHAATEHLKAVSGQGRVGIFIMRVGQRLEITFFNDGALAITGFTYEQMRLFSKDASAFFRGNNLARFRAEVRAANDENRLVDFLYESHGFVGKDPHQTHLYGVKLDVQNDVPSYLILMVEKDWLEPNPNP
jgi:diguanylate cyclase (GGDEF)-like protein